MSDAVDDAGGMIKGVFKVAAYTALAYATLSAGALILGGGSSVLAAAGATAGTTAGATTASQASVLVQLPLEGLAELSTKVAEVGSYLAEAVSSFIAPTPI